MGKESVEDERFCAVERVNCFGRTDEVGMCEAIDFGHLVFEIGSQIRYYFLVFGCRKGNRLCVSVLRRIVVTAVTMRAICGPSIQINLRLRII